MSIYKQYYMFKMQNIKETDQKNGKHMLKLIRDLIKSRLDRLNVFDSINSLYFS